MCINYSGISFIDESQLRLFHFEGSAWVDSTVSLNPTTNIICGVVSSFSPFVIVEPKALTVLGPVTIWVGLTNSDDVGIRFDLRAEVYKAGTLVGSGQVNSVAGGSGGFEACNQRSERPRLSL